MAILGQFIQAEMILLYKLAVLLQQKTYITQY